MWRNCYVHNIVFPFCWLFFFLNHSSIYLKVSLTLQFGLLAVHLSLTIQTLNFVHRLKVLYRVFTMVLVNSVALSLVACLYRNLAPLWSSAFMEVVKKYLLYYCLFLRKKKIIVYNFLWFTFSGVCSVFLILFIAVNFFNRNEGGFSAADDNIDPNLVIIFLIRNYYST